MKWNGIDNCEGSVQQVIDAMKTYLPEKERLIEAHNKLIERLEESEPIYVVRNNSELENNVRLKTSGIAFNYQGYRVVTHDNEATVSNYDLILDRSFDLKKYDYVHELSSGICVGTFKEDVNDRQMIKNSRGGISFLENLSLQNTFATGTLRANKIKYSHIAGVKQDRPKDIGLAEWLKILTYRNLSPLNIFPTPSKRSFLHKVYLDDQEFKISQNDFGEEFLKEMALAIKDYLGNDEVWAQYLKYSGQESEVFAGTSSNQNLLCKFIKKSSCTKEIYEIRNGNLDENKLRFVKINRSSTDYQNEFFDEDEFIIWNTNNNGKGALRNSYKIEIRRNRYRYFVGVMDGVDTLGVYEEVCWPGTHDHGTTGVNNRYKFVLKRVLDLDFNFKWPQGPITAFVLRDEEVSKDIINKLNSLD
jgi:hypothetical protein